MTDRTENQLIADLSHKIVTEVAPEELQDFQPMSEAYFNNPEKTLKGETNSNKLTGAGIEALIIVLTPFILDIVKDVIKDLLKDSLKDSVKQNAPTLLEKLKALLMRFLGDDSPQSTSSEYVQLQLPLDRDRLTQARQRAYEKAIQLGVDVDKANLIANSVMANLQSSP